MKHKQKESRPFLLGTILFALSIISVVFLGLTIYVGVFYAEAQKGMEDYLSELFNAYPFSIIYAVFLTINLLLCLAILLMWFRKTAGIFLFYFWSICIFIALMIDLPHDWFNVAVLIAINFLITLYFPYFLNRRIPLEIENLEE